MVAAPYKVTLVVANAKNLRDTKQIPLTASDVNAAAWVFPSAGTEMVVNGKADVYIVDVIYSAAGTDTTSVDIFLNGVFSGTRILNATTLATAVTRPFQSAPFFIPAGTQVKFIQNT